MSSQRIIVAIEGVVHAGKTTLGRSLMARHVSRSMHLVDEYSAYAKGSGGFPAFPRTSEEALLSLTFFLQLEERRFRSIPWNARLVILDRSVLSLLAFDYALDRFSGRVVDKYQAVKQLVRSCWVPQVCLYLNISDTEQVARHRGDQFSYEPTLLDPAFNAYQREFYSRVGEDFPQIRMVEINGEASQSEVLEESQLALREIMAG